MVTVMMVAGAQNTRAARMAPTAPTAAIAALLLLYSSRSAASAPIKHISTACMRFRTVQPMETHTTCTAAAFTSSTSTPTATVQFQIYQRDGYLPTEFQIAPGRATLITTEAARTLDG
eukprot:7377491-Prymnesium_polylepis.1